MRCAGNPDAQDSRFSTELGVYRRHCGLRNVTMSWGHDEYLWRVLQGNGCALPEQVPERLSRC
jgi:inositol oxygenase